MTTILELSLFIVAALVIYFLFKYVDNKFNLIFFVKDTLNVDNKRKNNIVNTTIIVIISMISCVFGRLFGIRQVGFLLLWAINVGVGMNFIFM